MTFAQYRRLLLVLLIPLLGAGLWLAEEEVLTGRQQLTECLSNGDRYTCISQYVSKSRLSEYRYENGGTWITDNARLNADLVFRDAVILPFFASTAAERSEARQGAPGVGQIKTIRIDMFRGARYENGGPCTFRSLQNDSGEPIGWMLYCGIKYMEHFKISSPEENERYLDVVRQVRDETKKFEEKALLAYLVPLLMPLLSFLALSAVVWLLIRAFRFVRG